MISNNTAIHLWQQPPTVEAHDHDGHAWVRIGDPSHSVAIHYNDRDELDQLLDAIRAAANTLNAKAVA